MPVRNRAMTRLTASSVDTRGSPMTRLLGGHAWIGRQRVQYTGGVVALYCSSERTRTLHACIIGLHQTRHRAARAPLGCLYVLAHNPACTIWTTITRLQRCRRRCRAARKMFRECWWDLVFRFQAAWKRKCHLEDIDRGVGNLQNQMRSGTILGPEPRGQDATATLGHSTLVGNGIPHLVLHLIKSNQSIKFIIGYKPSIEQMFIE